VANKYIIHLAAYCGDGTSNVEATSTGGVGALNSMIYAEGTPWPAPAVLAASDVVNIRSKDAAGADIMRTLAAATSLGSSVATATNWITWIIDNGSVWPGIDGTITYNHGASNYAVTFRPYNAFYAQTPDALVLYSPSTNPTDGPMVTTIGSLVKNAKFDWSAKTGSNSTSISVGGNSAVGGLLINPNVVCGIVGSSVSGVGLFHHGTNGCATLINPKITLLAPRVNGQALFNAVSGYANPVEVFGGRVSGAGATSSQALIYKASSYTATHALMRFVGFQFPNTMSVHSAGAEFISQAAELDIIGCDNGLGGHYERTWGYVTSRSDNYPPKLSATLPDSVGTNWSWRLFPRAPTLSFPCSLPISAVSQAASGVKTVALNLLVESTFTATKANTWIDVAYVDTDDVAHVDSSFILGSATEIDSAPLANWSSNSWYLSSFDQRKIEVTTSSAIKQDTAIVVNLRTTLVAANTSQVVFVDPEIVVT